MRSYCVKQKKQTECVPGSEKYMQTKNGSMREVREGSCVF